MRERLTHKIESVLWHPRTAGFSMPSRVGLGALRYVYAILRDITTGPLTLHAMGLVYVTILSLVPVLAVSFSVLKAFGYHRQIEPFLEQFLAPLGARGAELTQQITAFVDNAQSDVLAGIGLLFLFFTVVSMAEQVEGSFNQIWRVERPRSFGRRISEYLSVILVGPVVMVVAMALIAKLRSTSLMRPFEGVAIENLSRPVAELTPYLLVFAGFSFVYWFVPNTAVRARAALIGGLAGGTLWAGTGAMFAAFVVNAATTISIYATFAIVITALFWLYLCWLNLLVGAQVAFYVQNPDYMRIGYRQAISGTGYQEQAALAVMQVVGAKFAAGAGSTAIPEITGATGIPGLTLSPIIARLESAGLLVRTSNECLLPRRDPDGILLRDILHAVRHPERADVGHGVSWPGDIERVNRKLESAIDVALGEETLARLLASQKAAPEA